MIISDGRFESRATALAAANKLKEKFVDIFVVPVGENPDLETLKQLASREVENNVFMTSSYNALEPNLRSLTMRVCEGGRITVILLVFKQMVRIYKKLCVCVEKARNDLGYSF